MPEHQLSWYFHFAVHGGSSHRKQTAKHPENADGACERFSVSGLIQLSMLCKALSSDRRPTGLHTVFERKAISLDSSPTVVFNIAHHNRYRACNCLEASHEQAPHRLSIVIRCMSKCTVHEGLHACISSLRLYSKTSKQMDMSSLLIFWTIGSWQCSGRCSLGSGTSMLAFAPQSSTLLHDPYRSVTPLLSMHSSS